MRVELAAALGEELTEACLRVWTRAEVAQTRAPRERWEASRRGGEHAPPRSAVAMFSPHPVRDEDDSCTRHQALLLLAVLEQMWWEPHDPSAPRTCGSKLYLPRLAARIGVGVRELDRYLAILRTAGILQAWQPPAKDLPAKMRGKKHAYNVWRLNRALPRPLTERLKRFQVRGKQAAAEKSRPAPEPAFARTHPSADAWFAKHPHLRPPPS